MRGFLIPALVILIGGSATIAVIIWLRARMGSGGLSAPDLKRVLAAHGAARCVAATHFLQALAKREQHQAIAVMWSDLEIPLLEALPDCPPDYKIPLINVLDACSRCCRVVEVSRSIMTMRNSMIA